MKRIVLAAVLAVAERLGCTYVDMGRVNGDPKSRGGFGHPGDYGMGLIAEEIWRHIEGGLGGR